MYPAGGGGGGGGDSVMLVLRINSIINIVNKKKYKL